MKGLLQIFHVAGNLLCPCDVQNDVIGEQVNYRTKWLN
jgi:hypothetical protein